MSIEFQVLIIPLASVVCTKQAKTGTTHQQWDLRIVKTLLGGKNNYSDRTKTRLPLETKDPDEDILLDGFRTATRADADEIAVVGRDFSHTGQDPCQPHLAQ